MTTGLSNLKPTTLLTMAALMLASSAAMAQSTVTIYGTVDAGLLMQNHSTAGGTTTQLYSGGISPSIWGFRGSEDLGNGMKVSFNLESHFAADTGASIGPLFRRQSNVGLSSASLGMLTLGNMYSPAVLAFAATDPRGLRENFSGLYPWAYNSGALTSNANGNNTNNDVGVFMQNAIAYSNAVGPVNLAAAYSVAENGVVAGVPKGGAVYSLGATYTGPVSLSAAYQATNQPNTTNRLSTLYSVGAGYTMGALTGKVNYLRGVNKDAAQGETSNVEVIGLGVDWKTAPNNTVIGAAYYGKDKDDNTNKTTSLILSDEYALSKRTTLYGTVAYVKAEQMAKGGNSGLMTSVVAGGTLAGTNTALLNVGIRHSF